IINPDPRLCRLKVLGSIGKKRRKKSLKGLSFPKGPGPKNGDLSGVLMVCVVAILTTAGFAWATISAKEGRKNSLFACGLEETLEVSKSGSAFWEQLSRGSNIIQRASDWSDFRPFLFSINIIKTRASPCKITKYVKCRLSH